MFVDFNKTFNEPEETKVIIPKALVNYFSSKLPDDLEYVADDKGFLQIVSKSGSFTISGFKIDLTQKHKEILGENPTEEEIHKFFYNSQQKLPLKLIKKNTIVLNGKEVQHDKLLVDPYNFLKIVDGQYFAIPGKFPEPFMISFETNNDKMTFRIKRIANNSVHISKFESIDNLPLKIVYYFDDTNNSLSITMTTQFKFAKTVRGLLTAMRIYNAFIKDEVKIQGKATLSGNVDKKKTKGFNDDVLSFWEKVLKIEEKLNVSFIPQLDDISFNTMCEVEHLYQNLCNNKPIRSNQKVTIEGNSLNMEHTSNEQELKDSIGNQLLFISHGTYDFDIFGVKKELPCIVIIFNAVLMNYENNNDQYKLVLGDKSENETMFSSTLCFLDESDLESFDETINNNTAEFNNVVNLFEQAKKSSDYLQ